MSEYSYAPRHRTREPEYVTETTYIERGGRGGGARDLVYRPAAREDSIEEIPRDFPPGAEYRQTKYREEYAPPRRTRSVNRGYDDDYYDRPRRRDRDYDDRSEYSERPNMQRRKSIVDKVKDFGESAGLGGIIGAVTGGGRDRSRSRPRRDDRGYDSDRYGYYDERDRRSSRYGSRSRSRSRGGHKSEKWEQAAKAAIVAGAVEAFRSRKEAGPWTGAKGQRVATAALGAAGIDGLIDRDPGKHEKRHVAESALGGLVASRLANGSRSRSRAPRGRDDSRSRSRSRARSRSRSIFGRSRSRGRSRSNSSDRGGNNGIAKVAGTGAVLAAGKALYDRVRSKSRARKDRSRSSSSDSYVPSRRGNRRSYSRGRGMDDQYSEAPSRTNPDRRLAAAGGAGAGALTAQNGGMDRGRRDSSADSESSTDMEEKRKKLRGKELLTAGLATVATIHAAHGVYSSMVASENRRKLVGEGEMTAEEARKRKSKNMLQDAAAVGIAALGIKSAYSEWKEMNEQRHSVKELETRRRKRRKLRERREKEARMNALGGNMNGAAANPYAYPVAANQSYPTSYADANPYGSSVPPPPMGARY
ncbi:uncharacterized protein J4E88_003227 [Alternaria novae-zelandiae]|uniref:uncharacterized protein n=1 Tax=Alternaria metachromatica TaxID=283354 RepID=UPI0020C43626|nr:uncharacterized protein J4E83_006729 [Alternaria metachromatica]XP_049211583.1 uncharacterized protein J4E79_005085 [Alternaria viburni]XP_049222563.1 uncharacterized protein J4E78_005226 [Alternaria triticimaculans]XP_049233577.1 uncharacterized protein J4E87_005104 [Alternaria ethzedia]XP_049243950.1 uncharacterized protein J4E84_005813 [Alternaria hordeiaustralica]XP_049257222.1 uncharacterized protein J4E88_003227 [Alternaria novae-zelandiae]XP_051299406.1 uncharacterized protein J4E86